MQIISGVGLAGWDVLKDASFYLLAGFFAAGVIDMFLDEKVISRHLGRPDLKSVLWASLLGVPLPLCSCGVLPTAAALRKKGASKGATLAFLISTPESGVDSFFVSLALLDPIMAFFRPLAAFLTATLAGVAENLWGEPDTARSQSAEAPCCPNCKKEPAGEKQRKFTFDNFRKAMRFAFIDLPAEIGGWLAAGLLIAAIISYSVPENFIDRYLSSDWTAMLVMLAVGIPMYICASASTPIAAALILKGLNPGAALVFLLAGPATNAAGITVVAKLMGKRSVIIYLSSIAGAALALGALLDLVYSRMGINPKAAMGHAAHLMPDWLATAAALVLISLLLYGFFNKESESQESPGH